MSSDSSFTKIYPKTPDAAGADSDREERLGAFRPFFLRLPPSQIAAFKFLLESYEGLGILRTLNRRTGEVVILALEDTAETITELLEAVKGELKIEVLPAPESINEDWLLSEAADEE